MGPERRYKEHNCTRGCEWNGPRTSNTTGH